MSIESLESLKRTKLGKRVNHNQKMIKMWIEFNRRFEENGCNGPSYPQPTTIIRRKSNICLVSIHGINHYKDHYKNLLENQQEKTEIILSLPDDKKAIEINRIFEIEFKVICRVEGAIPFSSQQ